MADQAKAQRVQRSVRDEGALSPRTFTGHRKRKQVDSPAVLIYSMIKSPDLSVEALMLALPIFPGSRPPSIVGVHVLNFCVRNGNRWTHMTINTNSVAEEVLPFLYKAGLHGFLLFAALTAYLLGDPYRIRTDVNGVRGRCLNHLTNGPLVHPQGLEPGTH